MFSENKINAFTNPVAKLADRPQISAQALKAWFDSSVEELRVKFNAVLDKLDSFAADSFVAVDYNSADGKLTFTFGDGSTKTIDLPLELLIQSGHYDADAQCIVLVLANGDKLTIPVSDLIDEYAADEKTLHMAASEDSRIFSVKDGVFTPEAPADDALYGRKNGKWEKMINGLPEITLEQADDIFEGVYKVKKLAKNTWMYGVLCASTSFYIYEEDLVDIYLLQTIVWSDGAIQERSREDYIMSVRSDLVLNEDGTYSIRPDYNFGAEWSGWTDVYQSKWDKIENGKENRWQKSYTITVNTPIWANQPLIATLSADGTTVESTRAITAADLAAYATTEENYYKITFNNTDGTALPDGCFRVLDVFTADTAYNADLTEVFYLAGYNTGDYVITRNAVSTPNKLVDFLLSDSGVKQFRKAGDEVAINKLPIQRIHKLQLNGCLGGASDDGVNIAINGYFGTNYSNTKICYPSCAKIYTALSGLSSTTKADNRKVCSVSAELEVTIEENEARTKCVSRQVRMKDKTGTGAQAALNDAACEVRIPNKPLTTGDIIFSASTGTASYCLLNGTTLKLYYKNI